MRYSMRALFNSGAAIALVSVAPAWGQSNVVRTDAPPQTIAPDRASSPPEEALRDELPSQEQDIIVTGVLGARSIEKAPISITAISSEQLEQQPPASAADALKNVPGVFVNSALGEIRNVVFSRGVSANSLDADAGYFYVSLQEDGTPVEPILSSNFGPDYYSRPDIMLRRIEALRGGTAAITGPNAPGGIFNYISRTGKSDPGTEIRGRVGLEGNGRNEYYRVDAYSGGEFSDNLYYALGGFYRYSIGSRDPGYARNRGGQIRGNLLWDYGSGSLLATGKVLDDRNGFDEFLPAINYRDPKLAGPYANNTRTSLVNGGDRAYTTLDGQSKAWNPADAVHSRAIEVGLNWDQELGGGIRVENKARYSRHHSDWSVGAIVTAAGLNDLTTYLLAGTIGVPGTYSFRFPDGGAAATVTSLTGFDYNVTANALPNQTILANGVQTLVGLTLRDRSEGFQDTLTLSGSVGNHNVAIGAYYQTGTLRRRSDIAGYSFLTLEPDPKFLSATFTSPLAPGATFQLTGPSGFANYGVVNGGDGFNGSQDTFSLFASDRWAVTEALTLEGGLRYERLRYDITNVTLNFPVTGFGAAGLDGNPLTLYDNGFATVGAPVRAKRNFDYLNFSASASYDFSDRFNAYARFTGSKKAPSFGIIAGIDTPDEVATIFPEPQRVQQMELGLKYNSPGVSIQLFPFYSKLSNVADGQSFVDTTGAAYSPPPIFGKIETYGVEIQSNLTFGKFNLYSAVTVQNPKSSNFSTYLQNTPSRSDDQLVTIPDGDADNNPKLIVRTTGTVDLAEDLQVFTTFNYLGRRAANRFNAFYLPGFATVDLGMSYSIGKNFKLQANVTNLLNNYGILSWSRSGSLTASLDRQALTPAEVVGSSNSSLLQVIPSPPRAIFLTATAKFR